MTQPPDSEQPAGWWAGEPADPWQVSAPAESTAARSTVAYDVGPAATATVHEAGWTGVGWPTEPTDSTGLPARARRTGGMGAVVAVAVAVALVAGAAGGVIGVELADDDSTTTPGATLGVASGGTLDREPGSVAGIAQAALPSVVSIRVRASSGSGTGSGFVVRTDGYVVTNNHVIAAAAEGGDITVVFNDDSTEDARVVGRAPTLDIAVLKVGDVHGVKALALGDSTKVAVGDPVIAVGSPLGLAGTVTAGIVSTLHRPVTTRGAEPGESAVIDAIQTDAAINPGNSGGPLLDGAGRVIGVNSAIAQVSGALGQSGGNIGVGFAIPINTARNAAEEIIRTGRATRPVIGVSLFDSDTGSGAVVGCSPATVCEAVRRGGPADRAGIRAGDLIVEVDGRPVENTEELVLTLREHSPGDNVTLTVVRGGQRRSIAVALGSGPA